MKSIYSITLLLFSLLIGGNVQAQRLEKNVPIIVSETFKKEFPGKDPVWFSKIQGPYDERLVYEARFMFDNRYSKAFYENEGKLIAFATIIEQSELPKRIREYMEKTYPTLPVAESLLVTHVNNEIHYEIGVYIDNEFVVMTFNQEGQYLKTVSR
jgi:hypothetical protein